MKLFGLSLGKDKAVPFPQFRDIVRQAVRKAAPGARMEPNENGFNLTMEGKPTIACNLRNLYATYSKNPSDQDNTIHTWIDSLVTDVPEQTWTEALSSLRPTLRSADYLARAMRSLARQEIPDSIPSEPFVGDLSAIVMREWGGTLVGVTQNQLNEWSVTLEQAMREALNNMSMLKFPHISNTLVAGGTSGKGNAGGPEVGLVFEDNHLTATWLLSERFRDYLSQRLQSDYVVSVPNRSKLLAVRADEPGILGSIVTANRGVMSQPYALTAQCYHVSAATTGGVVTVYQHLQRDGQRLSEDSLFAKGQQGAMAPLSAPTGAPPVRDLTTFWGLSEPTDDNTPNQAGGR